MPPKTRTVEQYLKSLSSNDRVIVQAVRDLIRTNLPEGIEETMAWGFPTFQVPLSRYADPVDGRPMVYAAIDAEKRNFVLYLTTLYNDSPAEIDFRARWRSPSRRMVDFGGGYLSFRALKDLDLDLITETITAMTMDEFIASYHRDA